MPGRRGQVDTHSAVLWPGLRLTDWQHQPLASFSAWLAGEVVALSRQFRDTSRETYLSQFSSWVGFLEARNIGLLEATAADAAAYFGGQDLAAISRRRYLQLIDRVYRSLYQLGWRGPNPMTSELRKERLLAIAPPTGLNAAEAETLRSWLIAQPGWKGARDRALGALLLGAGLRAYEVMTLRLDAIGPDFLVDILPAGIHRRHKSRILPEWRALWAAWVQEERERHDVQGPLACPAVRHGRGFAQAGLFKRIGGWLAGAGIPQETAGANLLRTTFAWQAWSRYDLATLQECLGHDEVRSTLRYEPPGGGS